MSVISSRTIQIGFSGDVESQIIQSALDNIVSPAEIFITTLAADKNEIVAPVISGVVVTGLTIIPPAGNEILITMMGLGDSIGFPLHLTDPTSLALDPSFVSLVLEVAEELVGLRLIWS